MEEYGTEHTWLTEGYLDLSPELSNATSRLSSLAPLHLSSQRRHALEDIHAVYLDYAEEELVDIDEMVAHINDAAKILDSIPGGYLCTLFQHYANEETCPYCTAVDELLIR